MAKQKNTSGLPQRKNMLDRYRSAIETQKNGSTQNNQKDDTRFWQPLRDKAGNAFAVIRFLPPSPLDGEDGLPWVRVFDHGFQGPGGWYIENSLTTLGEKDPVSEYNSQLWNSGVEANKELARKQKRRLKYISRILVIKHAARPEDEGKEFLFKYGKKIYDKLTEAMNPPPEFSDEEPFDPFDIETGANFKLKVRMVDKFPNYDKSEFDKPSALEQSVSEGWSLNEFLDRKNFKSYDELKARLEKVLGVGAVAAAASLPTASAKSTAADSLKTTTKSKTVVESNDDEDEKPPFDTDEDDDIEQFRRLAEED